MEIKKKQSTILSAPQPDDRVEEQLETLMTEVQSRANKVKVSLKSKSFEIFCEVQSRVKGKVIPERKKPINFQIIDLSKEEDNQLQDLSPADVSLSNSI